MLKHRCLSGRAAFCGLLICLSSIRLRAQDVTKNIEYTTDATGTYRGDLYRPSGTGPFAAVVMIHGGSWRSGNKGEFRQLATDLAGAGYVGFSIDYDLHSHSFPTSWQEARAAVLFLRQHAAEYSIDRDKIIVMGSSAGGQIAALLATDPAGPRTPAEGAGRPLGSSDQSSHADVPLAAAVLLNGGYDLHVRHFILRRYLGGNCDRIAAVCDDASPDNHIRKGLPAMFVGHGNADHRIPVSQAHDFIRLLQTTGDSVTPFIVEGAPHSYWRKKKYYASNLEAVKLFLSNSLQTEQALEGDHHVPNGTEAR